MNDDIARWFKRGVGPMATDVNVDALIIAGRRRRLRRLAALGVVGSMLVVTLAARIPYIIDRDDGSDIVLESRDNAVQVPNMTGSGSVESDPAGQSESIDVERCQYPDASIRYLPWEAEDAGPVAERVKDTDAAQLVWLAPAGGSWEGSYVTLSAVREGGSGPSDETVPVRHEGVNGYLEEGEGAGEEDVADVGIIWTTADGPCETIRLTLVADRLTLAEGRREIVRIALSIIGPGW